MNKTLLKISNIIIATTLVLVPFYAFLTVWASTFVGHFEIIRLWDDVLLFGLFIAVSVILTNDKKLRTKLVNNLLFKLIISYVFIFILIGVISYIFHDVRLKAFAYSLLVNTRFLVWFIAIWVVSTKDKWLSQNWPKLIYWPLFFVGLFGLMQFFVLPDNFLAHFGYNATKTYVPIITINQNTTTIRIQSFLRGTNELGAYLVVLISVLLGFLIKSWTNNKKYLFLLPLSVIALLLTFSRSAWIGAVVAVVLVAWLAISDPFYKKLSIYIGIIVVLILLIGFLLFKNNHGIQDAFLHVSSTSTAQQTSNAGHESAIKSGLHDLLHEPFGRGPGTAGPSSLYNTPHAYRNSESYFLEIGMETGWIGLILFGIINLVLFLELYSRRKDTLAIGLLGALVGLSVINLFTYGWADDTISFVFWALAAIELSRSKISNNKLA